jgi:hypothetical protein
VRPKAVQFRPPRPGFFKIVEDLNKQIREKGYAETRLNWERVLPKIREHRQELLTRLQDEAVANSHGNLQQRKIERKAAEELLNMSPEEVETTVRDYDIFMCEHNSLLEDPKQGFKLEAQRHWIPILISEMKGA